MTRLFATVLMDAPEDPKERLRFEAKYFVGQDTETERVRPVEKHLARVLMGDKPALIVDEICTKYKVSLVKNDEMRDGGFLRGYTDAYDISRVRGPQCLEFIFHLLYNIGWIKEGGLCSYVIRMLRDVWVAHPQHRKEIFAYLAHELKTYTPNLFMANAKTKYPKRTSTSACVLYIEDMICEDLDLDIKIVADDKMGSKIIEE